MRAFILLASMAVAFSAVAEKYEFSRYECILTRQMFGAPPAGFDPLKMPSEVSKSEQKELTKEQEKLQSAVHFSVINITPEGDTMVGFTDNSNAKEPRHYYIKVGEQRDGWKVLEADPAKATMTIVKDDIQISLSIGGNSAKDSGATSRAGAPKSSVAEAQPTSVSSGRGLSLRGRQQHKTDLLTREILQKVRAESVEREKAEFERREAESQADRQEIADLKEKLLEVKRKADEAKAQQKATESKEEPAETKEEPAENKESSAEEGAHEDNAS